MAPSDQRPTPILKTEAHLHLYGCLSANDLWEIGKDRYVRLSPRLDWFAAEYAKVFGLTPDWKSWWANNSGFDLFRKTFEFTAAGPFSEFQAKFNLLIALNPPMPDDFELATRVFRIDSSGAGTKEYRTFLPMYLSASDREQYLLGLLQRVKDFASENYRPLLALSLMRPAEICEPAYSWLQGFCAKHPWTVEFITGIDFCASEVGQPPKSKKEFIAQTYRDNTHRSHRWHVLYHVGEMWDQISLASAARWVVEAAENGAQRLGHAMALGVDPRVMMGKSTTESLEEFHDHLRWLETHEDLLSEFGYGKMERADWQKFGEESPKKDQNTISWHWTSELCDHVERLQNALLKMVKDRDPLIEVCMTSNMRIGTLSTAAQHPLRRFLSAGLQVCASTDDPGIFAIDLRHEECLLKETWGCSDMELELFERTSVKWLSRNLFLAFLIAFAGAPLKSFAQSQSFMTAKITAKSATPDQQKQFQIHTQELAKTLNPCFASHRSDVKQEVPPLTFDVQWLLTANGEIRNASVQKIDPLLKGKRTCVENTIRTWRFINPSHHDQLISGHFCSEPVQTTTVKQKKTPALDLSKLGFGAGKPVIYLYPERSQDVDVRLHFGGILDVTYPRYDRDFRGWHMHAAPDGTLTDPRTQRTYSYLFWEGRSPPYIKTPIHQGFVVPSENSEEFLVRKLTELGLKAREYNEFIVYWLPKLLQNKFNLIHFAGSEYTETAKLTITPKPDSIIRIMMLFEPLTAPIAIDPQSLPKPSRHGFTVVEWGASELPARTMAP